MAAVCIFEFEVFTLYATTSDFEQEIAPHHRALRCRDILTEIFEVLAPQWLDIGLPSPDFEQERERRKNCRRTLSSCARVCHAFSEPALDVISLRPRFVEATSGFVGPKCYQIVESWPGDLLTARPP